MDKYYNARLKIFSKMTNKLVLISLSCFIMLGSCKSDGSKNKEGLEVPDSVLNVEESMEVSDEAMEDIVQNIASPVETAALIKTLGVPFSKDYLASADDIEKYATNYQKAFALGVFGADLGYINMYNKNSSVLDYITAIKKLADGINVGQFFDFSTLKRLASNSQNLDSLMYISVHSFNEMDSYLRENKRGNLSALMITGVWIEGLYLATQVAKERPEQNLVQSIGEQKTILNQLMLILENYRGAPYINDVIKNVKTIKDEFDNIKITIEVGEPESVVKDGKLMIIQNEKSIVHISDQQLEAIINKAENVRNELTKLK